MEILQQLPLLATLDIIVILMLPFTIIFAVVYVVLTREHTTVSVGYQSPNEVVFSINVKTKIVKVLKEKELFHGLERMEYDSFASFFDTKSRTSINARMNDAKESNHDQIEPFRINVNVRYKTSIVPYVFICQKYDNKKNTLYCFLKYNPLATNEFQATNFKKKNIYSTANFKDKVLELAARGTHRRHVMYSLEIDGLNKLHDLFSKRVVDAIRWETINTISMAIGSQAVITLPSFSKVLVYIHSSTLSRSFQKNFLRRVQRKLSMMKLKNLIKIQSKIIAGVATFNSNLTENEYNNLISKSSFSLLKSIEQGRPFYLFSTADDFELSEQKKMVKEIEDTMSKKKVMLSYQPIVSLKTGKPRGYTVTSKLIDLDYDFRKLMVVVHEFIGDEKFNFDLLKIILEKTREKEDDIYINFNADSILKRKEELLKLFDTKWNRKIHIFELTSTRFLLHESLMKTCDFLRENKIRFCIDNYDINHESIANLSFYKPESIKMTSSVNNIHYDDANLVNAISYVEYCKELKVKLIASRVENEHELYILSKIGVEFAEGYFVGKPTNEIKAINDEVVENIKTNRKHFFEGGVINETTR